MDAKKALKKLKKQSNKLKKESKKYAKKNAALLQLEGLKKPSTTSLPVSQAKSKSSDALAELKKDLSDTANQVLINAAYELATPFKPVLSWFNDGASMIDFQDLTTKTEAPSQKPLSLVPSSPQAAPSQTIASKTIHHLPLKSPPCKRCPALQNGICKCAAKRFKATA